MIKKHSKNLAAIRWLTSILLALSVVEATAQSMSISDVRVKESVMVDFQVSALRSTVVLPSCGRTSSGQEMLCAGAAHLEPKSGSKWVRVHPRFDGAILGGIGTDHKDFVKLGIAVKSVVEFVFSKDLFRLRRGDLLRVAVDTWKSEESFHKREPSTTVQSRPFSCP